MAVVKYLGEVMWVTNEDGKQLLAQRVRVEHPPGNYTFHWYPVQSCPKDGLVDYSNTFLGNNLKEDWK